MTRIFIVCPLFPPEPGVSGQMSFHVAETLSREGHDVTVVTAFPNRPAGKLYEGYQRRLFATELTAAGTRVVRCFSLFSVRSRVISRFAENISFGLTSGLRVLFSRRPDVIYANTWPIFAAAILTTIAQVRGIPVIQSVQDVYPESLISQGRISERSWVARLLRQWDGMNARRSHYIVAISDRFATSYREARGLSAERVHVVQNWVDERSITPGVGGERARANAGVSQATFLFGYGGNIGAAAGVELVISAFAKLPGIRESHLLIAGAGSQLPACRSLANTLAPDNVSFHSPWLTAETSAVLAAADVLVLPTHGEQSLVSVPSKLISYMLAAKPVIAQAVPSSDLAAAVDAAGSGWVVAPGDEVALTRVMEHVMTLPREELQRIGIAGRNYALQYFTLGTCLPRVIDLVKRTAERR
ncbi:MAG: glycosyltransferase [Gemmatimonadetes bacterium]|nr:glycosyltransferase [Gemmatimonadota bacterium]